MQLNLRYCPSLLRARFLQHIDGIGFISFGLAFEFRGLQAMPALCNTADSTWISGENAVRWQ